MADDDIVDISLSADDPQWLAGFTRTLVEEGLVACGNIVPGVRSIYRWEGRLYDDEQAVVVLHTRASLVAEVIARADADHPDKTPQVLAVPVVGAHPGYRQWVLDSTKSP
ncbi:divalent-cation tolerance protein CutA [Nocardia puris]|uniref:divalent-cation tolerance protein CutA n=1 Tax=Nocardia puris TaxID=208602 RepID=UPI0018960529|nr:divalent-cation tolerance protein CutA [Nocardia puris]MBF6212960.1 divalent-cation tolerance protein CutA [Nocardia puris]MBF6367951.1 divalent-cation tolerance protein CutA [Nocardia puris]MBF6462584.1 divalent-cation tolerance protein CutA [Nocardia puris]